MVFLYDVEKDSLCRMESEWGLRFQMRDGILYVQTSISCWKLVYSKKEEKIALYHRNSSDKPVDFKKPQYEQYHRQKDCPNGNSISKMCRYLYEHDRYREAQQKGIQLTTFVSKRGRKLAERTQRREQQIESRRRLDYLFASIEHTNKGYRELSYC